VLLPVVVVAAPAAAGVVVYRWLRGRRNTLGGKIATAGD
jgi:hypothetical protein